jgi:micrococcal nuclease
VLALLVLGAGCVSVSLDPTPTPPADATATPENGTTVRVTDVVDGDTVDVRFSGGRTETVRLLGVDTPEVHGETDPSEFEGVPDTEAGRACLRRQGERASAYATERLGDRRVTLQFDDEAGRRGGYDRLLAVVVVDGESFNDALLSGGHARLYDTPFRDRDRYANLEREARAAARGVWSCTA